jgi:hypothetical protein
MVKPCKIGTFYDDGREGERVMLESWAWFDITSRVIGLIFVTGSLGLAIGIAKMAGGRRRKK